MDDLDAARLERRHILFGTAPGGLDDLDAAFLMAAIYSGYGGAEKAGKKVRLTPNGLSVMPRQRAISFASNSGVFCVNPVMIQDLRHSIRPPRVRQGRHNACLPG